MNLSKSLEYFNPIDVKERIHIIGCGSTGSTIAEGLTRLGLIKFSLYDFDVVETKNIVNQMFSEKSVGLNKAEALKNLICEINSTAEHEIHIYPDGYRNQPLDGYVFLCVDNIENMRSIVEKNRYNINIKVLFNTRTTIEECQLFSVDWKVRENIENLLKSMMFTNEEARAISPKTACGEILGVAPSVREICNAAVCNFVNYQKGGELKKLIVTNPFKFMITTV